MSMSAVHQAAQCADAYNVTNTHFHVDGSSNTSKCCQTPAPETKRTQVCETVFFPQFFNSSRSHIRRCWQTKVYCRDVRRWRETSASDKATVVGHFTNDQQSFRSTARVRRSHMHTYTQTHTHRLIYNHNFDFIASS